MDLQNNYYVAGYASENNPLIPSFVQNVQQAGYVAKLNSAFSRQWVSVIIGSTQVGCDNVFLDDNQQVLIASGYVAPSPDIFFYDGQGNTNRTQICKGSNVYTLFLARYEASSGKILEVLCYPVTSAVDGTVLSYSTITK